MSAALPRRRSAWAWVPFEMRGPNSVCLGGCWTPAQTQEPRGGRCKHVQLRQGPAA